MGVSVFPVPSVDRTASFIVPLADGVHLKIQRRHVNAPGGVIAVVDDGGNLIISSPRPLHGVEEGEEK